MITHGFRSSLSTPQPPEPELLTAHWSPGQLYSPPVIIVDRRLQDRLAIVYRLRPGVLSNRLHDVMDCLRDYCRLVEESDPIVQQASREILPVAEEFHQRWMTSPGLSVQLASTHGTQNTHVRIFWITQFAAMALKGRIIRSYTTDCEIIRVYLTKGGTRWSPITLMNKFYDSLLQLPVTSPPSSTPCPNEKGPGSPRSDDDDLVHTQYNGIVVAHDGSGQWQSA